MDFVREIWGELKGYTVYVFIGGFGGVVYLFSMSKKISFGGICQAFVVASFSGLMAGMIARSFNLSHDLQLVSAGLAGFVGGFAMIWMIVSACKKIGIDVANTLKEAEIVRNVIAKGLACECGPLEKEKAFIALYRQWGAIDEAEEREILEGKGGDALARLLADEHITDSTYDRLCVAFKGCSEDASSAS